MHADELEWLDSTTGEISLRNVLVDYDFSPHSQLALQYALTLAQQYHAGLHMLHVLPPPIMDQPEIAWVDHTDTPLSSGSPPRCRKQWLAKSIYGPT
jgi:nucleotide-binding universal stress UspA family protein